MFPLNVLFAGGGVIAQVAELFPGELEVLRTVRLDVPSVEGGRPEAHQQEELKVALQPVEVGSKRGEELVQLAVFRRSKQSLAIRFVDRHQAGEGVEGVVELLLEVSLKTVRQHAPVGEDGPLRRREAIGGRLEVVGVGARWAIGPEEGVHAAEFGRKLVFGDVVAVHLSSCAWEDTDDGENLVCFLVVVEVLAEDFVTALFRLVTVAVQVCRCAHVSVCRK